MSFLKEEFNFKDLKNAHIDLFDNIEEDFYLMINNSLAEAYKSSSGEDDIVGFDLYIYSKKKKENLFNVYNQLEFYGVSQSNNFFSFDSNIKSLKISIQEALDYISNLTGLPLEIKISYSKDKFCNTFKDYKKTSIEVGHFNNKIRRLKLSCYFDIACKYGQDTSFEFYKKENDIIGVMIEPEHLSEKIKNEDSYKILESIAFIQAKNDEELIVSLPVFNLIYNKARNEDEINFFKDSLKEVSVEIEKNQILRGIPDEQQINIKSKKRI